MVIDARAARAFLVGQPGDTDFGVAAPPHRHLVVVQIDELTDLPVRHAVGSQQHDSRPPREASLHRP
jgi:hypothetical protein